MNNENKKEDLLKGIISFCLFIGFCWYFWGGGIDNQAHKELNKIENQVANDAVKQYDITVKGGNKTDMCVQAGMVSAAFLQAKDENNYTKWKKIEHQKCSDAGIPQL